MGWRKTRRSLGRVRSRHSAAGPDGPGRPIPAAIPARPATGQYGRPASRRHLPRRGHSGNITAYSCAAAGNSSGKPSRRSLPRIIHGLRGGTCRASGLSFPCSGPAQKGPGRAAVLRNEPVKEFKNAFLAPDLVRAAQLQFYLPHFLPERFQMPDASGFRTEAARPAVLHGS